MDVFEVSGCAGSEAGFLLFWEGGGGGGVFRSKQLSRERRPGAVKPSETQQKTLNPKPDTLKP